MRIRLVAISAPLLGLLECGPITVPSSNTPVNACTESSGCIGAEGADVVCAMTESGAACVSTLSLPSYVLVVNVPEGAIYAAGQAFTLTPNQIACGSGADCLAPSCKMNARVPSGSTCVQLPGLSNVSGAYVAEVTSGLSSLLGNSSAVATTVPVQTSYVPIWTLSSPACEPQPTCNPVIEASLLNLPLPTVFAQSLTPIPGSDGLGAGTVGPEGTATTGWTALLPAPPSGYVQVVDVVAPFDADFPPFIQQPSKQTTQNPTFGAIPFASPAPMSVAISPAEVVKGWTVFFRDRATRRVLSSEPVVQDGSATLQLFPGQTSTAYDIVLSPPSSVVALPEFADSYIVGQPETYPLLPEPVTVTGTVRSPAGKPVSASLHFASTALYNYPPSPTSPATCTLLDTDANLLHYDVVVSTSDRLSLGGAVGEYAVALPQGEYTITVDPDLASGFAKTQIQPVTDASSGVDFPPAAVACSKTEVSQDIPLEPLLNVTGAVSIADGRVLANATVELTPAASLLTPQPMPLPWPSQLAPEDGPRPFQVMTGADGSFSASVDPGAYDVTVRPADGTRLPWIVSPNHVFSKSSTTIAHLYVPAPVQLKLTLHDPEGVFEENPVTQAVVRAYAFTGCTRPAGSTTCNGVALQIGEAFTDTNGSLEMFLTPFPFTPESL